MIKFDKLIRVKNSDYSNLEIISDELNISRLTSKILINRGLDTIEKCEHFFNPTLDKLNDPFLLKDMDKTVKRIIQAIQDKEKIWIYGDYDVDGITSTSIMKIFFKSLEVDVDYYIPDRLTEGYGLNNGAMDYIHEKGGQLIITVDCGITSMDVVEHCNVLGMDIIITDHHQCGEELPNAIAVVNPHRRDEDYPFSKLAGVGVAFKVIQALAHEMNVEVDFKELLPIVAIGTVADVVSLTGENRVIVKNGLKLIKDCPNYGIQELIKVTQLENKEISSGHIGFVIGPRINAAGRIGSAKIGVKLFTTVVKEEAAEIAKNLDEENKKRQEIEGEILKEAEMIVSENIDVENRKVLILSKENWHSGVIGIVSSRITEKYHRPSVVITVEGDKGKGSARSISTFDIYDALYQCKDLFLNFGGHKQAAGLSIKSDNIETLNKRLNNIADEILTQEDLISETVVDSEINFNDISVEVVNELKLLEPFGIGNSSPQFLVKSTKVKYVKQVGKENNHLKMKVEIDGINIDCIGFRLGNFYNKLAVNDIIDIVVTLEINDFTGQDEVQFNIKEIILSYDNREILNGYYDSFKNVLIDRRDNKYLELIDENMKLNDIITKLLGNDRTLVIVNNYKKLVSLVNELRIHGREIIKNTSISYNKDKDIKKHCIVINPYFDTIDTSKYKYVIYYDDLDENIKFLEEVTPTIEELRIVYKTLMLKKQEKFIIDITKFLKYIMMNFNIIIPEIKLLLTLDILRESELLDYKNNREEYYIVLKEKPKTKIKITDTLIYKSLNKRQKCVKNTKK